MAISSNSGNNGARSSISGCGGNSDNIELETLNKPLPGGLTTSTTTPILKRKSGGGSKRLQFTTPEYSVTPIASIPGINNNRLLPSRRR